MSTSVATGNESSEAGVPVAAGAASGLGAYLVGYLTVYLWKAREVESALSSVNALAEFFGGNGVPTWKAVGWLFYNAHAVSLQVPTLDGGTTSRNLVGGDGATAALYVVPPLFLLVAGFLVARWSGRVGSAGEGVIAGASLAAGYVVLAVAGAFIVAVDAFGSTMGPNLLMAAMLAGLVYPAAFGGLGGLIAAAVTDD